MMQYDVKEDICAFGTEIIISSELSSSKTGFDRLGKVDKSQAGSGFMSEIKYPDPARYR
jgi:hypothetical protein